MAKSDEMMDHMYDMLPAGGGAVYANLPEIFRRYNALAARTYGDAEFELFVVDPDEEAEPGTYAWVNIEELFPGPHLKVVN